MKNLLNKQDRDILKKLISTDCRPLKDITPVHTRPKINTKRFIKVPQ